MNKNMTIREDHESLLIHKAMRELEVNQRGMSALMDCSNVVHYWANGFRLIPKSFKRFIIVLRFVKMKGLMPELMKFIEKEERKK